MKSASPQTMFRMGLMHSHTCLPCTANVPNPYLHAVWRCAPVNKSGRDYMKTSQLVREYITASPFLCVVGDLANINVETDKSYMLLTSLSITKKPPGHEKEVGN